MSKAQQFMKGILQPFPEVDQVKQEKLFAYLNLVLETNRTTNLTAITSWEEAVIKHLYDSLFVIRLTAWAQWPKILDLGSGAGLPAVPWPLPTHNKPIICWKPVVRRPTFCI